MKVVWKIRDGGCPTIKKNLEILWLQFESVCGEKEKKILRMALTSWNRMNIGVGSSQKTMLFEVSCSSRKRDRGILPYKVVEITPPPKSLGVRSLPPVSYHSFFIFLCLTFLSHFRISFSDSSYQSCVDKY